MHYQKGSKEIHHFEYIQQENERINKYQLLK